MTPVLKLYVKVWCPWCVAAEEWLTAHGYRYTLVDVEKARTDYDEMIRLSGQRLTPTLVTAEGLVLTEVAAGVEVDEVRRRTGARLIVSPELRVMS